MKKKRNYYGTALVALVVILIVLALSLATMWLWNWLMPALILGVRINLLQAAGLLAFVSLLTFDKSKLFEWAL
jgi:protein-S-isoprenylcysteine O-methyltransferase Ste14